MNDELSNIDWTQSPILASALMHDVGVELRPGDWVTLPYSHGKGRPMGRALAKVLEIRARVISSSMNTKLGFQVTVWLQIEIRGIRAGFRPVVFTPLTHVHPFPACELVS